MTTAQQESESTPPVGLTATTSTPGTRIHHNVQETHQNLHSGHQFSNPSDTISQAASMNFLAADAVTTYDAGQVCHHGEPSPDTVSESNEDRPLQTSNIIPDDVEEHIIPEDANQTTTIDLSHGTLTGGVESAQQPSSASSSTLEPAPPLHQALENNQDISKPSPRPPLAESLGVWACVTLIGGTALNLAVLGFLVFLWAGEGPAGGERATYVWRKIMLSESWPAQTITICAVVVRTIAAAQAAICTSLVAALLLERRRLPLSKAVPVSIKRGVNDGPFNLLREVLSWKVFRRLCCVEMALLVLVTMVTFSIQFTSTLLLSGFDTRTLIEFPKTLHHNVILSAEAAQLSTSVSSFSQFPPSYALFGELETSDTPAPNERGVSDTGVKLRSFVPFSKEERTELRAYKGPAFSEKTQVVCMRPNMDALLVLDREATDVGNMNFCTISGSISYESTFEEADLHDWELCSSIRDGPSGESYETACLPRNFTCTVPLTATNHGPPNSVMALCHPAAKATGTTGTDMYIMEGWNASSPLWSANAYPWVYLALSTNLSTYAADQEIEDNKGSSISLAIPTTKAGEWNTYQLISTAVLNVTLCFAGLGTDIFEVSMFTETDPREPDVKWDLTALEDGADPGQRFMGTTVSNLSAAERGIMSITDVGQPSALMEQDLSNSSWALWYGPFSFSGIFSSQGGGSWIMCNSCDGNGWAIPPDIGALFQRTIHTTDRAAWAIQNFLTTYTESWYAQILPKFDVAADIDVTFSTQLRIPRHWAGLSAALAMVVVDLVCVWTIVLLYVIHTRHSRQGNVWHTVSQIMSDDTRLVLEQSNRVKDKAVEKVLRADDYLVFLGKTEASDKVSLLRS